MRTFNGTGGSTLQTLKSCFPSPAATFPENIANPLTGVFGYPRRCWIIFSRAPCTFFLVEADLMLEAVPFSSAKCWMILKISYPCGIYTETNSVWGALWLFNSVIVFRRCSFSVALSDIWYLISCLFYKVWLHNSYKIRSFFKFYGYP